MPEGEVWEAVHQTLCCLERQILPPTPDAHTWFAYDPLPLALFIPGIEAAANHLGPDRRRFLDVGCGIGTKLVLMRYLGWDVAGIEAHGPYAYTALQLHPEVDVLVSDLRDVERFTADLVYMYRPAVAEQLEGEIERHVVERMTEGTVLFLPCRQLSPDLGLEQIAPYVWVK